MNGFPIIIIILLAALLGFALWRFKQGWSTVFEGAELTEQASDQFALMQAEGIRCRIRSKSRGTEVLTAIEVHKYDVDKARQLLEQ